ncbi:CNP1-like family protein [Cupriavidus basilensis]|uniref:CNP1-like family protein n=1 Tax=Cupriavidus basilensis TaxID=68895 RepID=A0ABT6AZB2_9BURK|nr:CNP1-like family protein [Cupriavidus basilensis]MDF3837964.1 CNP1-like family protein [Cupriavidus basilensis]
MIDFAGRGLRQSLPAACLLAATLCLGLAGCGTTAKPAADDEEYKPKKPFSLESLDPFAPKDFTEGKTTLPALPRDADLIPFDAGTTGNFDFAVDGKSVLVGEDGAVRYTVVITSPSGIRTASFEAVRCDSFERKLFATLPKGATEWVPNGSENRDNWARLSSGGRNNYAATLAKDFLCEGRSASGRAEDIVKQLRGFAPTRPAYR